MEDLRVHDDVSLVTGLKKRDDVLIIGGNVSFPYVKKYVSSVKTVKKSGDLAQLASTGDQFGRVFIARENVLDDLLVRRAAQLVSKDGLLCFFSDDEGMRAAFAEIVEGNFPDAEMWSLESNVGPVVVTNAHGNSTGMD